MKTTLRLLICIVAILQFGCANQTPQQRQATAFFVQKAVEVAASTIFNVAISPSDKERKAEIINAVAIGLVASEQNKPLTSEDVATAVNLLTPEKNHWKTLAADLAVVFATEQKKGTSAEQTINMIAEGLQKAASSP